MDGVRETRLWEMLGLDGGLVFCSSWMTYSTMLQQLFEA